MEPRGRAGQPATDARCREFLGAHEVLPLTAQTAEAAADVKAGLRSSGRPIPENDVGMAAVALEQGLVLVTRDDHFQAVKGLAVERW